MPDPLEWMAGAWPHAAVSLVPVCSFLAGLQALDSFKLVRMRHLAVALAVGMFAALVSFYVQTEVARAWDLGLRPMSRYAAPVVEELAKGAFVIFAIRMHRVGFVVDAAVIGFAVGAGFALAENVYYLHARPEAGLVVWTIRGLGTAVMHGGATSILAMIAWTLWERTPRTSAFLPGFAAAAGLHSVFNHFILPPLAMTGLMLVVLPPLLVLVFLRSERATRAWLGDGFDADQRVLEHLTSRHLEQDRIGRYLQELRDRFDGEIVADMLCLLRLRAELSIKAKGLLLLRESGFRVAPPSEIGEMVSELRHLEHRIGPTGLLALRPVLRTDRREKWELQVLGVR